MNFRHWHLHILASTALLATTLSFDAVAQTNEPNAHPVAKLEENTKTKPHASQSTARDFSAILHGDTWLDPNTKTLLGEFLHIGAVEEFRSLFASNKFNELDSTAKRQVINAVSEFAQAHHIGKAARMATSEAMTHILQGEVLSGKAFPVSIAPSADQGIEAPKQLPAALKAGTQQSTTPVPSAYSALTQTPVGSQPSPATAKSPAQQSTTPVPSAYSALTQTPVSQSPVVQQQTQPVIRPQTPVSQFIYAPVGNQSQGAQPSTQVAPVIQPQTPASGTQVQQQTQPVVQPQTPVTQSIYAPVGNQSQGAQPSTQVVPVTQPQTPASGTQVQLQTQPVVQQQPVSQAPAIAPQKSQVLADVLVQERVTDKPAQILTDVFSRTKNSMNLFKTGGEYYKFSQAYDDLVKPKNQARIAALTPDERKQFANAVEALKTKALADPKSPGIKNIQASSDKVFNMVDRLDRHENLHGVIKTSLGKTIDHNAVSGDVQTYLAQYKQDKLTEWKKASWTKIKTGTDADFWHWQEAYEGVAKDPNFAKLPHEMQVAVSGELSTIAHREQANLKGDAPAAIKATDTLHNVVTSNVRDGVIAQTAINHPLPDPAATPHTSVTHDVAELPSIADSKAIVLKKVDKGAPDLGSKAVGTVSTELLSSVDEKGKVKKFYGGTVKLGADHENPTFNDYYKWRALQIAQQAKTDPVGAEASLHALKNELAAQKTLHHGSTLGGLLAVGGIKDKKEANSYIAALEKKIQSALNDPAHAQAIADTHALHTPIIQKSLEGVTAAHAAVEVQHTALGTAIGQATQQVTNNGVLGNATQNQAAQQAAAALAAQHAHFVDLHNGADAHTADVQTQKAAAIGQMKAQADALKGHLAQDQHDALLAHIAQLEAAQADHAAVAQAHSAAFSGALIHNQGQAEHQLIGGNRPPITHVP